VEESVRLLPWLVRIVEVYRADLPIVLDPQRAQELTAPWPAQAETASAFSGLLLTLGDADLDRGDRRSAAARYALAWSSVGNWKAGVYLADLVQRAPAELDADGHILSTLAAASVRREMAPTGVEGWRDLSRFHVVLAQDHEKRAFSELALKDWERALAAHRWANDLASEDLPAPGLYAGLGEAYLRAERPGDAAMRLQTAAEQYLTAGRSDEARHAASSLLSAAVLQRKAGDVQAAEAYYTAALGFWQKLGDEELQAYTLLALGSLPIHVDGSAATRLHLSQALDLYQKMGDVFGTASTLVELARAYESAGDLEKPRVLLEHSLALGRELGDPRLQARALVELASVEKRRGRASEALAKADAAVALIESVSPQPDSTSALAEERAFEIALDLRLAEPGTGHEATAFELHERAQARRLWQVLVDSGVVPAKLQPGDQLLAALARPRIRPAQEIQAQLEENTLLLEYALGDERSYLWALTPSRLDVYELPPRERIEKLVRSAYARWSRPPAGAPPQESAADLAQLSRLLLPPPALRAARRLIVVPDGVLQYLPFAALPLPGPSDRQALVIDEFEVITLPSASALANWRQAPDQPAPSRLLAVLAGEPGSRPEAEKVASVVSSFQPGRVQLDLKADRQRVSGAELSDFRVVHFTTEGRLDARFPDLSNLSLFPLGTDPQPDRFGLRDIYGMKLKAELVVLSGSTANLGGRLQCEGVVGVTQGFQYAGAGGVMLSLWSPKEVATLEFLDLFYRALLQKGQPPATALRQAQLALRRKPRWQNPYFWAPFILQGIGQAATTPPAR
jgi:CHAT domain-containing protein